MASTTNGVNRFYLLIGALVVAGGGALWFLMRGGPTVSIPANVVVTAADTSGFRGYVMGSDSAPVEVTEYADYQCPWCQEFETVQMPDIKARMIDKGMIRWRYKDFPIDNAHRYARLAMHAAACGDEQGKFWDLHKLIYDGQPRWSEGGADNLFREYAKTSGLDVSKYDQCMQSRKYAGRIQASANEGARIGVKGTPTFLIAGRLYESVGGDQIYKIVDSLVKAKKP